VGANLGDGSVSGSEEEVSVGEEVDGINSLGEESLDWAESFEKVMVEANFDDVSGLGTDISEFIGWVDDATGEHSPDGVHEDLVEVNLLLDEVAVPGSNTVVVDGHALG